MRFDSVILQSFRTRLRNQDAHFNSKQIWIGALLLFIAVASFAQTVKIGTIKYIGTTNDQQKAWLNSQLPFQSGDEMPLDELKQAIHSHNIIMEQKEEWFTSYQLMLIPPKTPDQTHRNLLLSIKARSVNSYDAGGAWFYYGNHNYDLVGARIGVTAGYNSNGLTYEKYVGKRTYFGSEAMYSFSIDEAGLDTNYHETQASVFTRHEWSNTLESKLSLSYLNYSQCNANQWFAKSGNHHPAISLNNSVDLRYFKRIMGVGATMDFGTSMVFNTDFSYAYHRFQFDMLLRSANYGRFENTAVLSSKYFRLKPTYMPQFSNSQAYFEIKENQAQFNAIHFLEVQQRLRISVSQLGFTQMNWGALGFWEGAYTGEKNTKVYHTFGPGTYIAFANPVAVEVVGLFGFLNGRFSTLKIESRQYF